ncbi:MAG: maleylpyruvate isomerase N-terminal domain-containing protein [Actinobacteria bacterium]|nr:maleylpyruvate isomerase N-terminal domain-containing protein [Actinomycetota bacterium]
MAFQPDEIAGAAARLRQDTVALLDDLATEQLDQEALPGWSVADVFRHLAERDRSIVLGKHLLDFLPGASPTDLQRGNDRALQRLRGASRYQLREELQVWGRRLQRLVGAVPRPLARLQIPTMFGTVSIGWFATTRLYDEWVHQDDVHRVVGGDQPPMDRRLRELLAHFHLAALPAQPLRSVATGDGVVEVTFTDAPRRPTWRFDLGERRFGPRVTAEPTVHIRCDVATWCLIAADRIEWEDAESGGDLRLDGDDRAAATAVLDAVRVV